jgi:hypothetical protein
VLHVGVRGDTEDGVDITLADASVELVDGLALGRDEVGLLGCPRG